MNERRTELYRQLRERDVSFGQKLAQSLSLLSATHRESARLRAVVRWTMRTSTIGRAVIVDGQVALSNEVFAELVQPTRGTMPWRPAGPTGPQADPARSSLRELVRDEAQALIKDGARRRTARFVCGEQRIEVTLERALLLPDEFTVLVAVRELRPGGPESELSGLRTRIEERQRQAAVGELAMGVAHDLGNLVSALSARLRLLESAPPPQRAHAHVEAASTIVAAQAALVAKLRQQALAPQPPVALDLLGDVIEPAIRIAESRLRAREPAVRVEVDRSLAELPRVLGGRDDLVNVVINLLLNAADAMPQGGAVSLKGVDDHGRVRMFIDDEGTGIAEGHLEAIFRPRFTTKGSAGTGLGLSMAREVMVHAGGDIVARNRSGGGARLELHFLVAASEAVTTAG